MTDQEILEKLYYLYIKVGNFHKTPPKLELYSQLNNIGLTSLSSLILIMSIEEEFHIKIDLDTFTNITSVGGLINYIKILTNR